MRVAIEDGWCVQSTPMTHLAYPPTSQKDYSRVRCDREPSLFPGSRRQRLGRQHGAVRRRTPEAGSGRGGDRPAAPEGRGRAAGLPPGRSLGARRGGRRPLVRRPGGEPGGGGTRRSVPGARAVQLPAPSARGTRADAPRIAHWPAIRCPVLLLSGESDPFARIDLLRSSIANLARAELVTYPRLGHTLAPVLEDVLDRTAAFLLGSPRPDGRAGPSSSCPPADRRTILTARRTSRVTARSRGPRAAFPSGLGRAIARHAHRAVPVGRSPIASPVRPPDGGPRRSPRGDPGPRHRRPSGNPCPQSDGARTLHGGDRAGGIPRQSHRPQPRQRGVRQSTRSCRTTGGTGRGGTWGTPTRSPRRATRSGVAKAKIASLYKWLGSWGRVSYWWLTGSSQTSAWSHGRPASTSRGSWPCSAATKRPAGREVARHYSERSSTITYAGSWRPARFLGLRRRQRALRHERG